MTTDEQHLADQIIDVLGTANLSNEKARAVTRPQFWSSVFRNGWNTSEPNEHPGPLPDRRFPEATILAGTFNEDLPPSKEVVKQATKNNTPIPLLCLIDAMAHQHIYGQISIGTVKELCGSI
jgi:hypothetical protein